MKQLILRPVHRSCVGGLNFDYIAFFYLTNDRDIAFLREYLGATEPEIIIMAPRCTGLMGWSALNTTINRQK